MFIDDFQVIMKRKIEIEVTCGYGFLRPFVEQLPTGVEGGRVLCERRNCVRQFVVERAVVVVKQFVRPNMLNRLIYATLRRSKAARTMLIGRRLLQKGIETPLPLAYVDTYDQFGCYDIGYSVTLYNESMELNGWRTLPREEQRRLVADLAEFTARMHRVGFVHHDYHEGNIFYRQANDGSYRFSVVDINRGRFGCVLRWRCVKDLILFGFDQELMSLFVSRYAELMGWCAERMVRSVLRRHKMRVFDRDRVRPFIKQLLGVKPYGARI